MASDAASLFEERVLPGFENLVQLLPYRSLDEMLAGAVSLLIDVFEAMGGSILYLSAPPKRFQQGTLNRAVWEAIQHWEDTFLGKLREREGQVQYPAVAPLTVREVPDQPYVVVHVPLLGLDRARGVISLTFGAGREFDPEEERALGILASGVSHVAASIEQLIVTRQRLSQMGLFYQMGQSMASTLDVEHLFQDTIELAVAVIDAQAAALMLFDPQRQELVHKISLGGSPFPEAQRVVLGQGIAGWVARHGQPALLNHVTQDPRFDPFIDGCQEHFTRSLLCVPLQIKGELLGTLQLFNKMSQSEFDEEDLSVLTTLAAQASISLENARLYHTLRVERDRIIEAQENVRHELARNLHDGPVQLLSAISMRLDWLERLMRREPEAVPEELDALRQLTRQAILDARMLLFELRPVILETQGLVPALQSYVERLNENGRFVPHFDPGNFERILDPRVAGTIFSIVQEAITNIEKHAHAQNVWLRIRENPDELIVSVEDDGRGFDPDSVRANYDQRDSFGLLNMRERAELIEGTLVVESGPTRGEPGTLIQLYVPLPKVEESVDGRTSDKPLIGQPQ
jgi:signal transduction histidine kinase